MRTTLAVCGVLLFFTPSKAQLSISSIPTSIISPNFKSTVLGNAVVSLDETYGDYHNNPAGVGIANSITFLGDWENPIGGYSRGFFTVNYKIKKSGLSFSYLKYIWGDQLTTFGTFRKLRGRFNSEEHFLNASYNYSFTRHLRVGVGLNFVSFQGGTGSIFTHEKVNDTRFLTFDAGLIYKGNSYSVLLGQLTPHVGFSITNLGKPQAYYFLNSKEPLPTRIRTGGGITVTSDKKILGKNLVQFMVLGNLSKLASRVNLKGNETDGYYTEAVRPFEALITSWDTFEWNNGQRIESYSLTEQIWIHSGMEIKFLETFSVRFGREKAAKAEEWLSYKAFGLGIDLFYLSFNYYSIKLDDSSGHYYSYFGGRNWQLTGRIPLNGKKPDSILRYIFN